MGLQWKLYRSPIFLYAEMKCKKREEINLKYTLNSLVSLHIFNKFAKIG